MENNEIRNLLTKNKIPYWKLGLELNISENTIGRWLRTKLDSDKEKDMRKAIEKIKKGDK